MKTTDVLDNNKTLLDLLTSARLGEFDAFYSKIKEKNIVSSLLLLIRHSNISLYKYFVSQCCPEKSSIKSIKESKYYLEFQLELQNLDSRVDKAEINQKITELIELYHQNYVEQRVILDYSKSNKTKKCEGLDSIDLKDVRMLKTLAYRALKLFMVVHPHSYFNYLRARIENLESFPPTTVNLNDRIYREKIKGQQFTMNPMAFSGVKTQSRRIFERFSEKTKNEWREMFKDKQS